MSKLTILLVAFAAVATALPTHGKNVHKAPHPKKTHGRRVSAQTYHEDDDVLVSQVPLRLLVQLSPAPPFRLPYTC